MATKIEPCPFCGSEHLHFTHHLLSLSVVCQTCKSAGPHKRKMEDALAAWNATSRLVGEAKQTDTIRVQGHLHDLEDAVRNLADVIRHNDEH